MSASDDLNQRIGVLTRRETGGPHPRPADRRPRAEEFGRERVLEVLRETIIDIARQQGAAMAGQTGDSDLGAFADTLPAWQKDDAMRIETLRQDDEAFHFNVTRCRYAELYRALGIPELGALLSCNRRFRADRGLQPGRATGAQRRRSCRARLTVTFAIRCLGGRIPPAPEHAGMTPTGQEVR